MPETIRALGEVLDQAPVGLVLIDRDGAIAWGNATYRRWSATRRGGTASGPSWRDDGLLAVPSIARAIEQGLAAGVPEGPLWSADAIDLGGAGGPRYVDASLAGVRGTDTRPRRLIVVLQDATERVRGGERARFHYEAFLTSTNAIEVTDRDGVLVDVNPAFEATYGYSRAECLGKKPSLVRGRGTPSAIYEQMWAALLDPSRGHWSGEILNRDRWGHEKPVFLTVTSVKDATGSTTHYVGVAVDLTEKKTWEQVAAHSDRLASLGQLAAGVAHEINTPLANVTLVAESLRRRSTDPWTQGRAETIVAQVDVAARIVRGLLDFARRSEPQSVPLDLSEVARESVRFLRGKQSANVEVEERYPAEPLAILGDRGQLMQVLTNLLLNSYDALEEVRDGRITVETRRNGRSAEVEVRDTGPGIPVEALPHVFDPFFTTKPEGKGTGLGLAICHGIVQAHGGTIDARNLPGGGASLLVSLPLVPAPPRPGPGPAREGPATLKAGGEGDVGRAPAGG
jgi:PAS domain S-box-containing protein